MADDPLLNGDGREQPGRGGPEGNASSGMSAGELIRMLQEIPSLANNPEFMAKLAGAVQGSPSAPSVSSAPAPQPPVQPATPSAPSAPRAPSSPIPPTRQNAPLGLPTRRVPNERKAFPGQRAPESAADRRLTPPLAANPVSGNRPLPPTSAPVAPKIETPSAVVPPELSAHVPHAPEGVPVPPPRAAMPHAKRSKLGALPTLPVKPAKNEETPDLSGMAPRAKEPERTVADLAGTTLKPQAPSSVRTLSSLDEGAAVHTLASAAPIGTPDSPTLFLELLERRNLPPADANAAEEAAVLRDRSALERAANDAPMWLVSVALHLAIIILLAFFVIKSEIKEMVQVVSEPGFGDKLVLDDVFDPDASFETAEKVDLDVPVPETDAKVTEDVPDVSSFTEETAAPLTMAETALALDSAPVGAVDNLLGSLMGDDLSGRGKNKAAALATGGGTEGSEKSVALALSWLAEHQLPDGSWSYELRYCPSCGGKCRNSGSNSSKIAATAMGVLPFLAAGNTPTTGKYKRVVARGIDYLVSQGQQTENGLSFRDGPGNMYSHGLATIAICETYAMLTSQERARYRKLGYCAQEAELYIEYAQASDGGWRYSPQQPGDTSVSGWQMMALKSAQLAGLPVSNGALVGARSFLRDVVALEDGARYAYMSGNGETLATSAIGLLCRLYLDWRVDTPDLVRGANRLAGESRSLDNPYYVYYASQLLHNMGGRVWNEWNRDMREKLIKAQCMNGHERGSWFPESPDGHCQTGGRLYATSLNCMVLEVYYRHMPLYQKMEASEDFVLEGPGAKNAGKKKKEQDEPDYDFPIEDFSAEDDPPEAAEPASE